MLNLVSGYGRSEASTRVRLTDWADHLEIEHTTYGWAGWPDNRPARLVRNPGQAARAEMCTRRLDLAGKNVVVGREASPLSRGGVEERILREAAHGVFDLDDAIFLDVGGARSWLTQPRAKAAQAASAADVVIAGNEYLAEWASAHNSEVHVVPSCVEPTEYISKSDWSISRRPLITWLGSPSTEAYVAGIAPALIQVCKATGAQLQLISGPEVNPELAPLAPWLRRIPWSLDTAAAHLASADVAIAPLDDTAWARGKCAYKLLQYASAALPMVGSPVGANALALRRFSGIAATTIDEWVDGLMTLIDEPAADREARGTVALLNVHRHYSFASWASTWRRLTVADEGSIV